MALKGIESKLVGGLSLSNIFRNPSCDIKKSLIGVSEVVGSLNSNESDNKTDVVVTARRSIKAKNEVR